MDSILSHTEFGPKLGKPLLFVHGFPFDHRMWQAQADLLANRGYRVMLPDLRGFGNSPGGADSITRHVDDLEALAHHLVLNKFVLVGFSLGGYVALEYARKHPQRLNGLCLIDTRAEADNDEQKTGRNAMAEKVRTAGTGVLAEAMLPKMLTERTRKAKPDLANLVDKIMRDQKTQPMAQALQALRDRPDQLPNLAKITCPTLVIVGAEDPITPVAASQTLQKQIPNAQLRIITGAAHLSPMEAAEPLNHFLEDWLKNLDAPQMPKSGIQRLGLKIEGPASETR